MVKCLNCEEEFSKYMTQVVDLDTFPSLTKKAKRHGYTQVRVCEECYDKLAAKLEPKSSDAYMHPYLGKEQTDIKD